MSFSALFFQILPLYIIIVLGFIAGKWLKVDRHSIASLMIYMIAPLVFFEGILKTEMTWRLVTVPLFAFVMSTVVALIAYTITKRIYQDSRPNIIALASGTGNNGYFGLPIAMLLFDTQTVGIYLLAVVGVSVFESSIGFYLTARGQHTVGESLKKVLRLPTLHALILGCLLSIAGVHTPAMMQDIALSLKGAYTLLGMMMIGLGLSGLQRLEIDTGFTAILIFFRFLFWPFFMLAILLLEVRLIGFYPTGFHVALMLTSIMPLAANTVAIASLLNCHPERTATTVLLSTFLALLTLPLWISLGVLKLF
jgi:predicted permease